MNPLEVGECMGTLSELFPNSDLTEAELRVLSEELPKYDRNQIIDAMRAHRLRSRFNRPNFAEVLDKCTPVLVAVDRVRPKGMYESVIAQGMAKANPQLFGQPESELILRYHRFQWCRYYADAEKRLNYWVNLKVDDEMLRRRARPRNIDVDNADAMAELKRDIERVRADELKRIPDTIDLRLAAMVRECGLDLQNAAIGSDIAERAAGTINWPKFQFEEAMDDLVNMTPRRVAV
jgi:hypothetical protein